VRRPAGNNKQELTWACRAEKQWKAGADYELIAELRTGPGGKLAGLVKAKGDGIYSNA
jgi:hypothetical protein